MNAVIFDMDGTLIDSMPAYEKIAVNILCKYTPLSRDAALNAYRSTVGVPFSDQFAFLGYQDNKAVLEYHNLSKEVSVNAEPFKEATEFIRKFDNDSETHIAIVTSSSQEAAYNVAKKNWPYTFDWVSGIESGPKNIQIELFLRTYRIDKSRAVFFGDTLADAAFAKEAGVTFIHIKEPSDWKAHIGNHF